MAIGVDEAVSAGSAAIKEASEKESHTTTIRLSGDLVTM